MVRRLYFELSLTITLFLLTPFLALAGSDDSLQSGEFHYTPSKAPILERTSAASEDIYSPGRIFVDAGIHFGSYDLHGAAYTTLSPRIPLSADLEIAALEFIGIGGFFGYAGRKYDYYYGLGYDDEHQLRETSTSFGAKGVFHVIPFLDHLDVDHGMEANKYDFYITHYLGLRIDALNWVDQDEVPGYVKDDVDTDNSVYPIVLFPTIGARYMFTDFFGAYSEIGYAHMGGGEIEAGLTFRF